MTKFLAQTATALALGLGLMLTAAPAAIAQGADAGQRLATTKGSHIETRARGRISGGHYAYRGGSHVYRGGPRHYGGYNRGRYVAGGIAAGIAGAIILNEINRSTAPSYYYYNDGGLTCGQLEARCDAGQDWACRRLDRDPNC